MQPRKQKRPRFKSRKMQVFCWKKMSMVGLLVRCRLPKKKLLQRRKQPRKQKRPRFKNRKMQVFCWKKMRMVGLLVRCRKPKKEAIAAKKAAAEAKKAAIQEQKDASVLLEEGEDGWPAGKMSAAKKRSYCSEESSRGSKKGRDSRAERCKCSFGRR